MVDDGLKYDVMVERALRGVLREALDYAAEQGLPGEHHFYITFRTDHPEVEIPDHLHERFPSEMTIVLQHQFWSLEVGEESFGVTLSFSDVPEHLSVPFDSVIAFADPSVRFGLQFDSGAEEEQEGEEDGAERAETRPSAEIETLPVGKKAAAAAREEAAEKTTAQDTPQETAQEPRGKPAKAKAKAKAQRTPRRSSPSILSGRNSLLTKKGV
jgi:hypothetical protein